ncbi:membrane-bound PQQ-dependent dehydrogenase, glucose/quinate/shikimate family [Alloyangia pacifica]|uniref:membrane-bound PQQ-dependent dehydrogenase, glucose/quinate/shikimate family n=1 Tax=Alloyangia pacifica TaxID=311180 RepID=UPI001CFE03B7|nr:membrane-bound PQQ-dependent dehydrogenase, glucose/quinate/shikimate family [Alloyangia pacifica]
MTNTERSFRGSGILLLVYAVLALLTGAALLYLGARLALAGGSVYYILAALATLAIGVLILRKSALAVWLLFALSLVTLIWGLVETGWNGWAMIPRFDWLIVMGLFMAALWPVSRRVFGSIEKPLARGRYFGATLAVPAIMLVCILIPIFANPEVDLAEADPARTSTGFSRSNPEKTDGEVAASHDAESWTAYGGSNLSQKYSPAAEITPANAAGMVKLWEFHTGDYRPAGAKYGYAGENTPLKVGDTLYICTTGQQVFALDAGTGAEKWHFDPEVDPEARFTNGVTICRGLAYYEAPEPVAECQTRLIWGTMDSRLVAIDAETGEACSAFGENGAYDLSQDTDSDVPGFIGVTTAPTIIDGVAVVGHKITDGQDYRAPAGVVRGIDAVTGDMLWAWDLGREDPTAPLAEGEHFTHATPNVWSPMAADADLNLVFVGTGNASGDFYGADRTERDEEYTDAVIALDARTGKERWHFRTVNHDLWDFDIGPAMNLVDWPTETGTRPAIIQATKAGPIFVLDRETGEPLEPIEQYDAPDQPGVPDDWVADTQPLSPNMPNTVGAPNKGDMELLTEADAWGISPFDHLICRIQFNQMRYDGLYTPPTTGIGSIGYPGNHGGMNWGGGAIDPERGLMLINSERLPYQIYLIPRDTIPDAKSVVDKRNHKESFMPQIGLPYGAKKAPWMGPLDMPCVAPPWGYVAALDLRSKDVLWKQPMGSAMDSGPLGIKMGLPITIGTPSNGGPLATAGGMMFIGAALDQYIRGYDSLTGELVWEERTDAGVNANPMSYEIDGHQFVVAQVGGHSSMGTKTGDGFVAWGLPPDGYSGPNIVESSVILSGDTVDRAKQGDANMAAE